MGVLLLLLLGLLHCSGATESLSVNMTTSATYDYLPVTEPSQVKTADITSISFAVKTCNDAHLALSTSSSASDLEKGEDMYEIVIGGWNNTQSVIRKEKQGPHLANETSHRPLNCNEFRRFYVTWENGTIQVGAQAEDAANPGSFTDQPPFMSYKDPSPFSINKIFVSGWYGQGGTWIIDFPSEVNPQPEPCVVEIRTPASYKYRPVVTPPYINMAEATSVSFAVKTCNDAHLALSTSSSTADLDKGEDMYEIVIGGWANTQSVIRKKKQGPNLATKRSHRPLNCKKFRRFYVSWENGTIEVGARSEDAANPGSFTDQPPFLSYSDPSPAVVNHLFVSGWPCRRGTWHFEFPCKPNPAVKPPK